MLILVGWPKAFTLLHLLCCLVNACLATCWSGSAVSVRMCRPVPTRPSHYASGVLQPLRAFLDTDAGKRLQPSAQEELAQVCCCACSSIKQKLCRLQHNQQRHIDDRGLDMSALEGNGYYMGKIHVVSLVCSSQVHGLCNMTCNDSMPPIPIGHNTTYFLQSDQVVEGIINMLMGTPVSMTKFCIPAVLSTLFCTQSLPNLGLGSGCCCQCQPAICCHGFRAAGYVAKDGAVSGTSEEEQACRCCSCSRWRRAVQHPEDLSTALFGHSGLLSLPKLCLCCML